MTSQNSDRQGDPEGPHLHPHPHEREHAHPHVEQPATPAEPAHAHPHEGEHVHGNGEQHEHDGHSHEHASGPLGWIQRFGLFHSHTHTLETDRALESSEKGIRAVQLSLVILGATAAFQVAVVIASGSVALLADTIHNFTDALTALPLWLAFLLGRRPASRRYTHGFGRAEDLAGVFIVVMIVASALVAGYQAFDKLIDPRPLNHIEWVMAAAIIGFLGNEWVAVLRMRVGREIGSAALVADGQHARVDGVTSLAVLGGAIGVVVGFEEADPIVGLLIMFAILGILKNAAVMVWHRLMDAVDPDITHNLEQATENCIAGVDKVDEINSLKIRWVGHKLQVEINLVVDGDITTRESHALADEVRQSLFEASSYIASVVVHVEPHGHDDQHRHTLTPRHS